MTADQKVQGMDNNGQTFTDNGNDEACITANDIKYQGTADNAIVITGGFTRIEKLICEIKPLTYALKIP